MQANPGKLVLVYAVDLIGAQRSAFDTLIAGRDTGAPATCFNCPAKSGPEPLLAIWDSDALDRSLAMAKNGYEYSPRKVLSALGARVLHDPPAPGWLANANSPGDLP